MLEVRDLTTTYGAVHALSDVSFTAPAGKVTAVLGANGAGKTTLLRTISGLVRPRSGKVLLDDSPVTSVPVERMCRMGVAHVPEGRGVITELTVEENLRLGALGRATGSERLGLDHVYAMFPPLAERRGARSEVLSGGERQMLVIGRALLARPRVLLLDEPSHGLAPRVVGQIFALLRDLVKKEGLTVVLVEQNARGALSIADTAVVLNLGRVVVRENASELAADEKLRHAYLGF
jgi:branched-chain amino acid transport system ATP-binding protein